MKTMLQLAVLLLATAAFGQARECWTNGPNGKLEAIDCGKVPAFDTQWRLLPAPQSRPVTFWTMHRWQDPPLRTNRQTLRSPLFLGTHFLAATAAYIDVRRSHGTGSYQDAFIPLGAITALDYASDRLIWRPFNLGGAMYLIVRHSYGAATRNYP